MQSSWPFLLYTLERYRGSVDTAFEVLMPYTGRKQGLKIPETCSLAGRIRLEKSNILPLPHGPVDVACCGYKASVHSERLVTIISCVYFPIIPSDFGTSLSPSIPNRYEFAISNITLEAVTLLEH